VTLALAGDFNSELKQWLQQLKNQLPDSAQDRKEVIGWWKTNGQVRAEQLRTLMIEHRNIGHDWQFSEPQKKRLQQYYDANKLLVNCLNSACNASPEVRQEIEETLFLPIAEIEKRKQLNR
jgi:predicted NACHT family NTPase